MPREQSLQERCKEFYFNSPGRSSTRPRECRKTVDLSSLRSRNNGKESGGPCL